MRITFKGDYAVKSLLYLAIRHQEGGEHFFQITQLANALDIPINFLEQILIILRKAGYIKSHRGNKGGFAINKDPADINLGAVIRLIDGPIAPIGCVSHSAHQPCDFETRCVLKPVWAEVRDAISGVVDHISFQDLVHREQSRAESLVYHI